MIDPLPVKETFSTSSRRTIQAIAIIALAVGLGIGGTFPYEQLRLVLILALCGCAIGGYLIFISIETPARNVKMQGCGFMGFGLGFGLGGTFPDGTEWLTWLLCAFWCVIGVGMLLRRPAAL